MVLANGAEIPAPSEVWSCDRWPHLAIEKPMETKDRSTRAKAPTHSTSDVVAKSGDSTSSDNDDMFPNPKGRSKSDGRNRRDKKLLHCKKRDLYGYNECPINTSTESKGRTG